MQVARVEKLCKEYPSFRLEDVSFDLHAGTVSGFIGRNGAGKTTTIKSMLNLIHADGIVEFFGMPLSGNEDEIKQRIGYSAGTLSFYPRKKLRDIISVTKTFYKNFDEAEYRKYLDRFSLDENKTPNELSEGMKVKFNLLCALSHHAEILILDEPTSGLDPFSRDELLDVFTELKEQGTAILFSTHITSDLEKCADDIIYISGGKIVSALPKADFTAKYGAENETLEQTVLRLEKEVRRNA